MSTTDTDALTERIARAQSRCLMFEPDVCDGCQKRLDEAARVLPIIAVEVRKAKAEAWDEGQHDLYLYYQSEGLAGSEGRNPYRETGDSDEHR